MLVSYIFTRFMYFLVIRCMNVIPCITPDIDEAIILEIR